MAERTRRIPVTDEQGKSDEMLVHTEMIDVGDFETVPGLSRLELSSTRETLNRIKHGHYKSVHTGIVFRSDDPRAP